MRDVALGSAGFLCTPVWKAIAAEALPQETPNSGHDEIPSLDELAGDWFSGKVFEQTPSICNFHGGIQAARNILAINSLVNFPLAQGGDLGELSLDGEETQADEYRWYAYQMLRRSHIHELDIVTTVRMPFEAAGVLFRVEFTNRGEQRRSLNVSVGLDAAIRAYPETWHWEPPRPEQKDFQDFTATAQPADGTILVRDRRSNSAVAFGFVQPPDNLSVPERKAEWRLQLSPGESRRLEFVMAADTDSSAVLPGVATWKADFETIFRAAKESWEKRFRDAFTPNNGHFSGNLPTLQTRDARLRRLYYMSVLSILELERTNLHPDFPRVIITAAPR